MKGSGRVRRGRSGRRQLAQGMVALVNQTPQPLVTHRFQLVLAVQFHQVVHDGMPGLCRLHLINLARMATLLVEGPLLKTIIKGFLDVLFFGATTGFTQGDGAFALLTQLLVFPGQLLALCRQEFPNS
ncbi:hypothetical protein SODG_005918 [Sodalis praecaptivus]